MFGHIPTVIQNSPYFHHISNDHVIDHKVFHLDAIIRVSTFLGRVVLFKGFRTVPPLVDGLFHGINQGISGDGILEPVADIVHNLVQVILEEGRTRSS